MRAEVLVVGAGPAGMAAAVRAAACAKQVVMLDDNLAEGGQIWRGGRRHPADSNAAAWFERFEASGAKLLSGSRIVDAGRSKRYVWAETATGALSIEYEQVILATGARELFLPFPGWTRPRVIGVGGIQALAKAGMPVAGKRIVVAGSGPLLLAVAAWLRKAGAIVPAIVEQAPWNRLVPFVLGLTGSPAKLLQAVSLRASLGATPYWTDSWVTSAEGADELIRVHIRRAGGSRIVDCDLLAVAYGLIPNTELATMLGCSLRHGAVAIDEYQRTDSPGVLCAGEATGIGGVELSLVEGEIAGCAAGGREDLARTLFGARQTARRFAGVLNRTFAPRDELRHLSAPDTLVCRCEDVSFAKLRHADSWRSAKLHSRCGMGPCQGRVCGPAAQFLFGWTPESVRPPLFPARLSTFASHEISNNQEISIK